MLGSWPVLTAALSFVSGGVHGRAVSPDLPVFDFSFTAGCWQCSSTGVWAAAGHVCHVLCGGRLMHLRIGWKAPAELGAFLRQAAMFCVCRSGQCTFVCCPVSAQGAGEAELQSAPQCATSGGAFLYV